MTAIAFQDFKEKTTTFPWLRAGCLAANLSSPIMKDGIGRLLHKSDIDKLKTPAMKATITSCEANLAMNYETIKKHNLHTTTEGKDLFARFLIRSTLFVCKKQAKGREEISFDDLGAISSKFSQELHDLLHGTTADPSTSSNADQEMPESFEECVSSQLHAFIQHTSASKLFFFNVLFAHCQDSQDAKVIAKRKWDMEEDQFYHKKGDLKHWQFKSMNDTVATFEHMPLFPPKDGQPLKLEVELNQLKVVKKAATEPPRLLLSQEVQGLLPETLHTFNQENMRAEAMLAMTSLYNE